MLQLREKDLDEESFYKEAVEIKALCKKYNVPFIIKLAKKIDADGVHVGQNDMVAQDVRAIIGPNKILGVSTQTVEEAVLAEKMGADYLGDGAVFPTGSKDDCWVLEHSLCRDICNAVKIPVVAIGGITKDNIKNLKGLGFAGISVISARLTLMRNSMIVTPMMPSTTKMIVAMNRMSSVEPKWRRHLVKPNLSELPIEAVSSATMLSCDSANGTQSSRASSRTGMRR